jgi:hypothetical protein
MRNRALAGVLAAIAIAAGLMMVQGTIERTEAATTPKVILMRCEAMPAPTFRYQVTTLSHTPGLGLSINPSTVDGEGDDCAVAISQILTLQGITANHMTVEATEGSLIVTVVK